MGRTTGGYTSTVDDHLKAAEFVGRFLNRPFDTLLITEITLNGITVRIPGYYCFGTIHPARRHDN